MEFSETEAKHLQLSIDQIEKTPSDYLRSTQTLIANSHEHEKCSSTNTSLNSTSSSSSNRSSSKVPKMTRSNKQRKLSSAKLESHPVVPDDYPPAVCYTPDEHYYPHHSQSNYSNLALYAAAATGNYPHSFPHADETIYYDQKRMSTYDANNKRLRVDNNDHHHHHHVSLIDYEANYPSDKLEFYSPGNHYQAEHPYHHASVIVDSQQYFLNGWNGTTAF